MLISCCMTILLLSLSLSPVCERIDLDQLEERSCTLFCLHFPRNHMLKTAHWAFVLFKFYAKKRSIAWLLVTINLLCSTQQTTTAAAWVAAFLPVVCCCFLFSFATLLHHSLLVFCFFSIYCGLIILNCFVIGFLLSLQTFDLTNSSCMLHLVLVATFWHKSLVVFVLFFFFLLFRTTFQNKPYEFYCFFFLINWILNMKSIAWWHFWK